MSTITYTGITTAGITTASDRGRAVCVAPAPVRVVPSHATPVSAPVSTDVTAGFGAAWAVMSAVPALAQNDARVATDLKAAFGAPTFGQGHRTWSPPFG